MSTRIFASYLRQRGVPARQLDAPEIGFITTDDFGNADIIYERTLPKVCLVACWRLVPAGALLWGANVRQVAAVGALESAPAAPAQ